MPSNYLAQIHLSCLCCNQRDFDTPRRSLIYTRREAASNLRKATRSTQKETPREADTAPGISRAPAFNT